MNPERHELVKRLFLAACELDASRVDAFLDQACAGDRALRGEVDSLLKYHRPTTIIGRSPTDTAEGKIPLPIAGLLPEERRTRDLAAQATADPAGAADTGQIERFTPGAVVAGRYRVLGLLGRGGMGVVVRAYDVRLEQDVALKFLLQPRAGDPAAWRARFHREVCLARKVTHPNVNRIHDIGEADGELFISMEYVDGENLASLLRRIGRVSAQKGIQIARQLCAGLGAAHDEGVLHRDLKPANIMLDGAGRVRITDFGIASAAADAKDGDPVAGTPAYMAPELFAGAAPSRQSDIYALGVVLYELVTGSHPFADSPSARQDSPVAPSALSAEIDADMDRVILRCLQPDRKARPATVYAVAAGLPGGDPLAAAVAAGETPSPDMVAASGGRSGLRPVWALALAAVGLLGLGAVAGLADKTFFLPQAGLTKPPAVLADRAEAVIERLGHTPAAAGRVQGFTIDRGYLDAMMARQDRSWDRLADGRPPAIFFWYREGDHRTVAPGPLGEPPIARLAAEPGMHAVHLDGRGRLLEFAAIPPRKGFDRTHHVDPDWSVPFALAGLDLERFKPVDPLRKPVMYADRVVAWKGTYPEQPELPIVVEGAALAGEIVYFDVVSPWEYERGRVGGAITSSRNPSRTFLARFGLYLLVLIGGTVLAWRNVRQRRGDPSGAGRLALFVLGLGVLDWAFGERHSVVFFEEVMSCYYWLARATLAAAVTWVCYVAVEPYVRRRWPQTIVTWSRVLQGCLRDPGVGRDLLIGTVFGVAMVLLLQLDALLPAWFGLPQPVPKLPGFGYDLGELLGVRYKLGTLIAVLLSAVSLGLIILLLMLIARLVLRIPWLAAATFCLLLTIIGVSVSADDVFLPWLVHGLVALGFLVILTRVGLVAVIAGQFTRTLIMATPMTADLAAWYAPASGFTLAVVATLMLYGVRTAWTGEP